MFIRVRFLFTWGFLLFSLFPIFAYRISAEIFFSEIDNDFLATGTSTTKNANSNSAPQ